MVAPGSVLTNAHVVAGTDAPRVTTTDGVTLDATVVAFDPAVDLAVLRVPLDRPVLPLADPAVGQAGLVLGFPGGGPLDPSPFSVGELLAARGYDIYDRDTVDRELLVLASELAPGDSGSAVVRSDGAVVGVAVAVAPDRPGVSYALAPGQVRAVVAAAGGGEVGTGPCLG
jgi:S1-C subfamily serine protease